MTLQWQSVWLNVKLIFADGGTYDYQVPVVKVSAYTKDNIFEKKLLILLPFYVMRYEKKKKDFDKNPKELDALLDDYRDIQKRLEEATEKSDLYTDLMKLITKIADYIFRDEPNVKKGLGDVKYKKSSRKRLQKINITIRAITYSLFKAHHQQKPPFFSPGAFIILQHRSA